MRIWLILTYLLSIYSLSAQQKLLHYDETTGFNHGTRTVSKSMFDDIGLLQGFTVDQDSDGSKFTKMYLADVDLVVFSNTSGDSGLSDSQQKALEWYIDTLGGNLMGIHAASDTYRHSSANGGSTGSWDWYAQTIGGSVQQSPNHTSSNHVDTITLTNPHPSADNLTFPWVKEEEYYYWENGYLNNDIQNILEVDTTGPESYDAPRQVAWSRTNTAGAKIFYTSLGHKQSNFTGGFPSFEILISDAVSWLIADNTLPIDISSFQALLLEDRKAVQLKWKHTNSGEVVTFQVEHSTEGLSWHVLDGQIDLSQRSGDTEYDFIHTQPNNGDNYYRLKITSADGHFDYSNAISFELLGEHQPLIYPNPTKNKLYLSASGSNQAEYILYNLQKGISHRGILLPNTVLTLEVGDLPHGVYFLKLQGRTRKILVL